MIFLAALVVSSYLTFIYFAETLNPFEKPRIHPHRVQWRYGLRMALVVLISGFTVLTLLNLTELAVHIAIATGLVIASVLVLCFSIDKIRVVLHG